MAIAVEFRHETEPTLRLEYAVIEEKSLGNDNARALILMRMRNDEENEGVRMKYAV